MEANAPTILGALSLLLAVVLYLVSVTGLLYSAPTAPSDIGLVSTTLVFLLFGLGGLVLGRWQTAAKEQV